MRAAPPTGRRKPGASTPAECRDGSLGRRLVRRRWSVAASLLMLGLGIGSSTAVYSALHQVLFRPLGIGDITSLVDLHQTTPARLAKMGVVSEDEFPVEALERHRAENRALASVAAIEEERLALKVQGQDARRIRVDFVDPAYFPALGVNVSAGRRFTADEARGAEPLAVISDRLWQRAFRRHADALGQTILVNGRFCRVIGIVQRPFTGHTLWEPTDVWLPWGVQPLVGLEVPRTARVIARLAPGFDLAQASSVTAGVSRRFRDGLPAAERDETGEHRVRPFVVDRQATLDRARPRPWLLLAASMLMLLLACANVANPQLAELESRRREFASRAALGASRAALLRQVVVENLGVGLAACAVGLGLAVPLLALLARIPAADMAEPLLQVTLQVPAVVFALVLALLSSVAMAVIPGLRASRSDGRSEQPGVPRRASQAGDRPPPGPGRHASEDGPVRRRPVASRRPRRPRRRPPWRALDDAGVREPLRGRRLAGAHQPPRDGGRLVRGGPAGGRRPRVACDGHRPGVGVALRVILRVSSRLTPGLTPRVSIRCTALGDNKTLSAVLFSGPSGNSVGDGPGAVDRCP